MGGKKMDDAAISSISEALRALQAADGAVSPEALAPLAALGRQGLRLTLDLDASRKLGAPLVIARGGPGIDLSPLTPRQTEVALLVATGLSNKDIARMLGLSVATVKDHVHAILTRLGLASRAALIAKA